MSCNWPKVRLGDVCKIRRGSSPRPIVQFMAESGMPWVKIADATETHSRFIEKTNEFIKHEGVSKSVIVNEGDLILSNSGTAGLPKFMKITACIHDGWQTLSDFNGIDKYFLYYSLLNIRSNLLRNAHDSTMKNLTLDMVRDSEICLPTLSEQKSIATVLSDIDSKFELNIAINQTLEQMAQAMFKSWFVDFDPVKAKMNGEQPEGMDAATASLFPEKLVESELGLIPEGWKIQNTGDLFDVKDGTHDSPKKAEEGHYLVTSKHITGGKIDISSAYLISDADFEKVNQRSKVDTFDILLTMIGTVGEVVVVYDNPVEFAIKNVGLFKTSQRPELVWLFYWHLQSFKMKNYLEVRMAGTTQQYLTLKTLRTIPVVLPSDELLAKFNEVMVPLMEKISDNHNQNQTLSNLRDTLLPKLLSGEIDLERTSSN